VFDILPLAQIRLPLKIISRGATDNRQATIFMSLS
jgi:hypothetical protein